MIEVDPALPLPPLNVTCSSGFDKHTFDIWWSTPDEISANTKFNIIGVNIYRSFDSEFGPYFRMNSVPVQANFYRDRAQVKVVLQEDVSNSFLLRGDTSPDGRWVFKTRNTPIDIQPVIGTECADMNVFVTVDGVPTRISEIISSSGEVRISEYPYFDTASQLTIPPVLPKPDSVVLASYRFLDTGPKTSLYQRIFYRITTVAVDENGELIETPLDKASQTNAHEVEKLDWIWREAVRRNKFILVHGGERVKVFIRRSVGPKCGCYSDTRKQPDSSCEVCFGTSIIGGYDGPYDTIIAPDDSERSISQSNRGRSLTHAYETWTGPTPLLSQRDFVVKLNGDRYGIGPVRMPTNRGMQLQQHFSISHLDEGDIRYKVPVLDTTTLVVPQTRYIIPGSGKAHPETTSREAIPDEREFRGRSPVYENYHRRLWTIRLLNRFFKKQRHLRLMLLQPRVFRFSREFWMNLDLLILSI